MKNFLRSLQGDVASQVEASGVKTEPGSTRRIAVVAAVAAVAIASAFSTSAQAQSNDYYQQREAQQISSGAGQLGQIVGQAAGKNSNLGNELGRVLSVGASTMAKTATGQNVNYTEAGGTIGQVVGAVGGYFAAKDQKPAAKTAAILVGGLVGTVFGSRVGHEADVREAQAQESARIERANAQGPQVMLTQADQSSFLQSMQRAMATQPQQASNQRQGQPSNANPYSSFSGYLLTIVQQSPVRLSQPGGNFAGANETQLEIVARKAMEVAAVARQYQASEDNWDNGFLRSAPNQVKNANYWQVAGDLEMLKMKVKDYVQVRNAAATQGMDVSVIDRTLDQEARGLKPITNYGFQVSKVAPRR